MSEITKIQDTKTSSELPEWANTERASEIAKWNHPGEDVEALGAEYANRLANLVRAAELQVTEHTLDDGTNIRSVEAYGDEDSRFDSVMPFEDFAAIAQIAESHEAGSAVLNPETDTGSALMQRVSDITGKPVVAVIEGSKTMYFAPTPETTQVAA